MSAIMRFKENSNVHVAKNSALFTGLVCSARVVHGLRPRLQWARPRLTQSETKRSPWRQLQELLHDLHRALQRMARRLWNRSHRAIPKEDQVTQKWQRRLEHRRSKSKSNSTSLASSKKRSSNESDGMSNLGSSSRSNGARRRLRFARLGIGVCRKHSTGGRAGMSHARRRHSLVTLLAYTGIPADARRNLGLAVKAAQGS